MSDRLRAVRLAPLLLVLLLGAAWLAPSVGWLRLASSSTVDADRMTGVLDALPPRPIVLVGFDPDLGTYAEIRPTVRALLADLLYRQASVAIVSVTPEGRALALAELERLRRGTVNQRRILDLGFVPGAEAALVRLTRGGLPIEPAGALAAALASEGIAAVQAIVVELARQAPVACSGDCRRALASAIITAPESIPAEARRRLAPIAGDYLVGGSAN